MIRALPTLALAALPFAGSAVQERGAHPVSRLATADAQLDHARRIKLAMRGKEEPVRELLRERAVAAYRAVREYHPRDPAICAEAAFRAGELLRTGDRSSEALVEFEYARERGGGTSFRARGLLEIGHIHRRERRWPEALDAYLTLVADPRARDRYRDDASIWAGYVWSATGRADDARRTWNRVARTAEDPVDRIRAFDALALSWLDEGDPEAAAGVLGRCKLALSEAALEETEQGERVRNALLRMRIVTALQRFVRERGGHRCDACR